jgi:hypothetical protein
MTEGLPHCGRGAPARGQASAAGKVTVGGGVVSYRVRTGSGNGSAEHRGKRSAGITARMAGHRGAAATGRGKPVDLDPDPDLKPVRLGL